MRAPALVLIAAVASNGVIGRDNALPWRLKADLALLWARVRHKDTRPLLRTPNPRATLAELLETRTPAYEQAEFTVETRADWSIEQTTAAVLACLAEAGVVEGLE